MHLVHKLDRLMWPRYPHGVYQNSYNSSHLASTHILSLITRGKSMMKTLLFNFPRPQQLCIILIAGLCALAFTGESALAAKKSSFRVGVIDPQAVIEKSKAGSRALAGLKEHAQARENVMKNDQKELEKLQEELSSASSSLGDEEKKRRQDRFSQKFKDWQKRGQEFQSELAQKQRELVEEYMQKIESATKIVAKRHGFDIVIDKGSKSTLKIVLYHRDGLDLTNEVIKEFNKRFK